MNMKQLEAALDDTSIVDTKITKVNYAFVKAQLTLVSHINQSLMVR